MKRDVVGSFEKVIEGRVYQSGNVQGGSFDVRVIGKGLHSQAEAALGDLQADAADAQNTDGLAPEFYAFEALLLPLQGFHARVGCVKLAGERKHHGDSHLGYA